MQVPKRRSDQYKQADTGPVYLTQAGVEQLKRQLERLERDLPAAIAEVERTKEFGDFSENEEYKAAKRKMRGMHSRIAVTKDRLNRVEIIPDDMRGSATVQIGSRVTIEHNGTEKTYHILGPHESDPSTGKISNVSPLGELLLGKAVGEKVELKKKTGTTTYVITSIN